MDVGRVPPAVDDQDHHQVRANHQKGQEHDEQGLQHIKRVQLAEEADFGETVLRATDIVYRWCHEMFASLQIHYNNNIIFSFGPLLGISSQQLTTRFTISSLTPSAELSTHKLGEVIAICRRSRPAL
uniref:(northern house mosquito) hypothetical protein n=1 Tax=Culex pipiens TaxID=7175 RepID=A0A8D8AQ03_CULPI